MPRRRSGGRTAPWPRPTSARSPSLQTNNHAPRPAKPQDSSGGSMFRGMAWGIGFAIAQALMGPQTIKIESVASQAAPVQNTMASSTSCDIQSKDFQDCLNKFGSDISKCQFYMDMLSECKKNSASTLAA